MKTITRCFPNRVNIQSPIKGRFRRIGILGHIDNGQNLQGSVSVPELQGTYFADEPEKVEWEGAA